MTNDLNPDRASLLSQLHSVLQEVVLRRNQGEQLSDDEVLVEHPELAELLASGLEKLRRIELAGEQAVRGRPPDTDSASFDGTPRAPHLLRVRCPHCREPNDVATDEPISEVVCPSCGSRFGLANASDETWPATALPTLAHFDLVERVGMGSFGTVWKGRDRELDRTVAVKIPRQGSMDEQDVEKFLREARAAAQLKHPHIVGVHEVGRDGDLVFIVSDFVRGVSLDNWLTGEQPAMRQAAALCATIAEALHHAHERGVVHRDLKPANIMIDGEGQPHLMDFGLARRDAGEVTMTIEGQVLGTPAYMSPEQAQGESHSADRRSDIYSLGVILFQLVTGELPFRGNARMLMHHVIHDEPPSPTAINSAVPKDLATIALKCMEKVPSKRYQTAREVGDELRRFLQGEPIVARPVGRVEKTRRWARRNPKLAGLLATSATLLVAVAVVSTASAIVLNRALLREEESHRRQAEAVIAKTQALDAARQAQAEEKLARTRAEKVANFVLGVLDASDPSGLQNAGFAAGVEDKVSRKRRLLDVGAEAVATELDDQPEVQAKLLVTIGNVYRSLGFLDDAEPVLVAALDLRRQVLGDNHLEVADSLIQLGHLAVERRDFERAQDWLQQAIAIQRSHDDIEPMQRARTAVTLGWVLANSGRVEEANATTAEAVREFLATVRERDPAFANVMQRTFDFLARMEQGQQYEALPVTHDLFLALIEVSGHQEGQQVIRTIHDAGVAAMLGNYAVTLEKLHIVRDKWINLVGEGHPLVAFAEWQMWSACMWLDKRDEAETYIRSAADKWRRTYGDHGYVTLALTGLGTLLSLKGDHAGGAAVFREAMTIAEKTHGRYYPGRMALGYSGLAAALEQAGQHDEAAEIRSRSIDYARAYVANQRKQSGGASQSLAYALQVLGQKLHEAGCHDEAIGPLTEALDIAHPLLKKGKVGPGWTIGTAASLATSLERTGQVDKAIDVFRQAASIKEWKTSGAAVHVSRQLARLLIERGEPEEAIAIANQALDRGRVFDGPRHPSTIDTMLILARALEQAGQLDEAVAMRSQSIDLAHAHVADQREQPGGASQPLAQALHMLGYRLHEAGRYEEAVEPFTEALDILHQLWKKGEGNSGSAVGTAAWLASSLEHAGRIDEVIDVCRQGIAIKEEKTSGGWLQLSRQLARLLIERGQPEEAVEIASQAFAQGRAFDGPRHPATINTMLILARALRHAAKHDDAERQIKDAAHLVLEPIEEQASIQQVFAALDDWAASLPDSQPGAKAASVLGRLGFVTEAEWTVRYFDYGTDKPATDSPITFTEPLLAEETTSEINFCWRGESPATNVPVDRFALVATSRIALPAGRYSIHAYSDDGVRVWIDDRLAIDSWVLRPLRHNAVVLDIEQGEHDVRIEYFEDHGHAELRFWMAAVEQTQGNGQTKGAN